jgi:hypothetical protein
MLSSHSQGVPQISAKFENFDQTAPDFLSRCSRLTVRSQVGSWYFGRPPPTASSHRSKLSTHSQTCLSRLWRNSSTPLPPAPRGFLILEVISQLLPGCIRIFQILFLLQLFPFPRFRVWFSRFNLDQVFFDCREKFSKMISDLLSPASCFLVSLCVKFLELTKAFYTTCSEAFRVRDHGCAAIHIRHEVCH